MTPRLRSRLFAIALACAAAAGLAPRAANAAAMPGPLAELQSQLAQAALGAPGRVGVAVEDLATGKLSGFNANASLPAASTIKIPVMIEVFRQMRSDAIDLNTAVHLEARDKDWGWGDMADARVGTKRTVRQLLWLMITQSDNTATNMLIRLVGRGEINATMARLGLRRTRLDDDIRSQTTAIRDALRTSPQEMVELLDGMARDTMVDAWSSREMLDILAGQTHNGLLPQPLPKDVRVAHKTGSLHDTLNDVGIVYRHDEPYVIAVMTTQLPSLASGRSWIHSISRIAYSEVGAMPEWRAEQGIASFDPTAELPSPFATTDDATAAADGAAAASPLAPDAQMWQAPPGGAPAASGGPAPSDDGDAPKQP